MILNGLSKTAQRQIFLEEIKAAILNRRPLVPQEIEDNPILWISHVFPFLSLKKNSERHLELWQWANNLQRDKRPLPFIAIWPRGSGKSTSAELLVTWVGATERRKYAWYISGTQELADLHIDAIAALIETNNFSELYPSMGNRKLGKFGNSKGWRRNRLRCGNGFTVDALGLDVSVRGMKVEEQRPDIIILDDIDKSFSTTKELEKNIRIITNSILPAGSLGDCAILGIQNLIANDGFFGKIVNGTADYLLDCIVSGPHPAIYDLEVNDKGQIISGIPSWPEGQPLEVCQDQINSWGLTAFLREAQHEINDYMSIFGNIQFKRVDYSSIEEDLIRTIVVVDPAVTSLDNSDSHGISVAALGEEENIYQLYSVEKVLDPNQSIRLAISLAHKFNCREVYVETNQGGDVWEMLFNNILFDMKKSKDIPVDYSINYNSLRVTASQGGKIERAQSTLAEYERGTIFHVINEDRTHEILEKSLKRFPREKPFDLVDATVHGVNILRQGFTKIFM